jgi:methyl coenzyme M reductase gamma subunit
MKKIMFGGMFLVILITIGFVFAGPIQNNVREELKTEIQEAILENYSSFIELHQGIETKGKAFDLINEENFVLFAEMKQAILEQDYERVREIREELGINLENQKLQRNMQNKQLQKNQRIERNENKGTGHNKGNGQAMQIKQQRKMLIGQN